VSDSRAFPVDAIAQKVGGTIVGDAGVELTGLASLAEAGPQDLSFYTGTTYASALAHTRAGALLIAKQHDELDIPQVIVADPFLAVNTLMDLFYPPAETVHPVGIHSLAWVHESAQIGEAVRIMPFACVGKDSTIGARTTVHPGAKIGAGVRLGEDCLIWPNVVIREGSIIGARVVIHPGAVIGADGFGYAKREGRYIKVRHVGIVVIEDDVEIGANATVDRGTLGRTLIKRGVKLDNLVHIAHNVEVGEDTVMAAQCGVSGSTVIGNRVMMGGQVGLVDHLHIGDEALLIAQSGVIGDIPSRAKVSGYPARSHREVLRAQAAMRGLDSLRDKVRSLEKRVAELARSEHNPKTAKE
jgi:UDP-3-O-[3-hydroxymyristoyl] glucosamine N-acyltransferase